MTSLAGYILASPSGEDLSPHLRKSLCDEADKNAPKLLPMKTPAWIKQFNNFQLITTSPLTKDEKQFAKYNTGPQKYHYPVFIALGNGKITMLTESKPITDCVIETIFRRHIFPNLRKVEIFVDDLIRSCADETVYKIISLHGRTKSIKQDLSRISLYGASVTDSDIYSQYEPQFNFYSCGLAPILQLASKDYPYTEKECLRVRNDGLISTVVSTPDDASNFLRAIHFLIQNQFVPGWVPPITE